jgi:hypothetical protein
VDGHPQPGVFKLARPPFVAQTTAGKHLIGESKNRPRIEDRKRVKGDGFNVGL